MTHILRLGFMGITDIEFIHADRLESGDESRSLAIISVGFANAKSIKAAISMSKSLQRI
jgi:FMN-dependent NADH-azoreductase